MWVRRLWRSASHSRTDMVGGTGWWAAQLEGRVPLAREMVRSRVSLVAFSPLSRTAATADSCSRTRRNNADATTTCVRRKRATGPSPSSETAETEARRAADDDVATVLAALRSVGRSSRNSATVLDTPAAQCGCVSATVSSSLASSSIPACSWSQPERRRRPCSARRTRSESSARPSHLGVSYSASDLTHAAMASSLDPSGATTLPSASLRPGARRWPGR
mmetsp:Transcript_53698/g.116799  ORF Transcript_53698/g.116799 Transcript_53698/m.116799 type:complete len:220 (-) Transcript_53698:54-713(-)